MNNPVEIELSSAGDDLYVFFGGIAAGIAMPVFEFYNASRIIKKNKIFIRDFSQCWYQDGLPEISRDIFASAQFVKRKIEEIQPEKIYFVGNSMGGFAAISISTLIGKGEVIAFAPQTFISPDRRLRYRDFRWPLKILNTYRKSIFKKKIWDLRPLLLSSTEKRKISVFVSKKDRLDLIHAKHIACVDKVKIYQFEEGGHEIVKSLRDAGSLPSIMAGEYSKLDF